MWGINFPWFVQFPNISFKNLQLYETQKYRKIKVVKKQKKRKLKSYQIALKTTLKCKMTLLRNNNSEGTKLKIENNKIVLKGVPPVLHL